MAIFRCYSPQPSWHTYQMFAHVGGLRGRTSKSLSSWVDGVQAARQARKAIASGSACSHGVSYAYHGTWCGSSTSALFEAKLREGEKERERERETETETETEIETQRH